MESGTDSGAGHTSKAETRAEQYEKAFLLLTAVMLVLFLGALFYAAFAMGVGLPGRAGELDPKAVRTTAPFDEPGVREVAPGRYEAVVLGSAWRFTPATVEVPAGATVTFRATSADVIHGFHIEGTRVNVMLIPGQVTEVTYTFREPGTHLLICHEYCGVGHHQMGGEIVVTEPGVAALRRAATVRAGTGRAPGTGTTDDAAATAEDAASTRAGPGGRGGGDR